MKTSARAIYVSIAVVVLTVLSGGFIVAYKRQARSNQPTGRAPDVASKLLDQEQRRGTGRNAEQPTISQEWIDQSCARCHRVPPPDILPRFAWKAAVSHMLTTAGLSSPETIGIPADAVTKWYEDRAPEQLPLVKLSSDEGWGAIKVRHRDFLMHGFRTLHSATDSKLSARSALAKGPSIPGVSNVRFFDLVDDARLELIICDMWNGLVLMGRPYDDSNELDLLARVAFPAHAELIDLDHDSLRDLVVADLGSLMPADHQNGSVVWLRNRGEQGFEAITLLANVGRVADVRAADFDGDGDTDLIVAEFGCQATGRIILLENRTDDWDHPYFEPHLIDPRHGTIHVPITDLDHDGRPDFIALISQEHEVVVAFLNRGGLQFEPRELYRAPHPAWGSSGLELVDLDGDGDLDILVTNGDSSDFLPKLRPYHGITWLENVASAPNSTGENFPHFVPHSLLPMYGVHRAEAADLDGDGDLDIVACSFIPLLHASGEDQGVQIESILWLEQTEPGKFVHHSLELNHCDHPTLALGDYDLDGDIDIAVGNYIFEQNVRSETRAWVRLWENQSR